MLHFFRCAAHTLNLVASADSKAALKPRTGEYARLHYKVFGILSKLWSKYNQSPKFSGLVREKMGKALMTPTATRWNSTYDSVKRVLELREKDRVAFNVILDAAKLPRLTDQELSFLDQWEKVMRNLAAALDHLQGDKAMYLGHLLPTITFLKSYINDGRRDAPLCKPLVNAILAGIDKRFGSYFERREMLVAAAYLPEFKVSFLEEDQQGIAKNYFIEEVEALEDGQNCQVSQESASVNEKGFYPARKRPRKTNTARQEVELFLIDESEEMESINNYSRIKKVFIKYNVILPSSASSERLFSQAKLLLRSHRQRIADENFEKQLLLLANKAI